MLKYIFKSISNYCGVFIILFAFGTSVTMFAQSGNEELVVVNDEQTVADSSTIKATSTAAYDPLSSPNTFRNSDNPFYWKNNMPYAGYWQQDVYYKIDATLDEHTHIITATQHLTYWNNSPDTLTFVFFHLYQNAFQPGSYFENLTNNNNRKTTFGQYEKDGLGTTVDMIQVDGEDLVTELDNTIMKAYLPSPLMPGSKVEFDINFSSYFGNGSLRRRMKRYSSFSKSEIDGETKINSHTHYNGVHWYPRISVYDRKFGWTTDQHLGKEFYGDFGCYDVTLSMANDQIIEATGYLVNRASVLPAELREKLDVTNFKENTKSQYASVIIPYDSSKRKTWVFHAENVHDFAFTADPTYRLIETTWNDIKCIGIVQEPHAYGWQNSADYISKVIEVYSTDIGMYVYHKIIAADARSGMEYPMITLDSGTDPGYRGLLAHEIGHNWFFGIVGNNETYRAALDEGFTQFLTSWVYEKINGEYLLRSPPKSKYRRKFLKPTHTRSRRVYGAYLEDAMRNQDAALNTHSDGFNGALAHGGGYRHVYYKTATMLYNLQYVLGDDLFIESMQHYYKTWSIRHPYFIDFRNAIIQHSKVDLNWFFDQWMETTKTIDYGIKSVKREKENEGDNYIIQFERKQRMQMPIDFQVIAKDGKVYDFHIPNTWFVKNTEATVLPKWYGWDKLEPTYKASVQIPGGIKRVIIDPSERLADINLLDNDSKLIQAELSFDSKIRNTSSRKNYQLKWRPDIWYNSFDGLKGGLHLNGQFAGYRHIFRGTVWYNTGVGQGGYDQQDYGVIKNNYNPVSFTAAYSTPIKNWGDAVKINLKALSLDGMGSFGIGFSKNINVKNKIHVNYKSMWRLNQSDTTYLIYPMQWGINKYNNSLTIGAQHDYAYMKGWGKINVNVRSSSIISDYDQVYINFKVINQTDLGKFRIRTRTFAQLGSGMNSALESDLYFAGASPEEMMDNKYTRSRGTFPLAWSGFGTEINHFHAGGGLNMRGYAGYVVIQGSDDSIFRGNSGASVNAEIEFDKLIKFSPSFLRKWLHLDSYLFGDAGLINYNKAGDPLVLSDIRIDAGLGFALTIKKFGALETVRPLTIRFDMPLFLNRPPAVENTLFSINDFIQFRWMLGINRAF